MYLQAWKKYLPVVIILIKRSAISAQTLSMDANDFIKSSGGKKLKLGFSNISVNKGRMVANAKQPEVVKDLMMLLNETASTKNLLLSRHIQLSMTNDCTLSISNAEELVIPAEPVVAAVD